MGRRSNCDLVLDDTEVSSQHCTVRAVAGEWALVVTDLSSTNGTYAAGRRVRASARLGVGSMLQIGRHVLVHERHYRSLRTAVGDGPLDDDCSTVAVTFL